MEVGNGPFEGDTAVMFFISLVSFFLLCCFFELFSSFFVFFFQICLIAGTSVRV